MPAFLGLIVKIAWPLRFVTEVTRRPLPTSRTFTPACGLRPTVTFATSPCVRPSARSILLDDCSVRHAIGLGFGFGLAVLAGLTAGGCSAATTSVEAWAVLLPGFASVPPLPVAVAWLTIVPVWL